MLEVAFFFLVVALIAGVLGFTGLAKGAATIAKVIFGLFLVIFIVLVAIAFGVLA